MSITLLNTKIRKTFLKKKTSQIMGFEIIYWHFELKSNKSMKIYWYPECKHILRIYFSRTSICVILTTKRDTNKYLMDTEYHFVSSCIWIRIFMCNFFYFFFCCIFVFKSEFFVVIFSCFFFFWIVSFCRLIDLGKIEKINHLYIFLKQKILKYFGN